jgi:hypothetical protein
MLADMSWRRLLVVASLTCALAVGASVASGNESTATSKIGVASGHYLDSDPQLLSAIGATWAYDWGPNPPPPHSGIEWVPMVWGTGDMSPQVISALRQAHRTGAARYLLGFNEPDNKAQANMTPAQAAALWPQLESTGLILGSPAPALPEDGWLTKFMKLVHQRHLRVNFIALHYYQDFTDPNSVARLEQQLIAIHNQFHLPIWVTEIGTMNIRSWGTYMRHAPTHSAALTYMRQLFPMLNALPFVKRYAWFTDNCSNDPDCYGSLYDANNQLTSLGRLFQAEAETSS